MSKPLEESKAFFCVRAPLSAERSPKNARKRKRIKLRQIFFSLRFLSLTLKRFRKERARLQSQGASSYVEAWSRIGGFGEGTLC